MLVKQVFLVLSSKKNSESVNLMKKPNLSFFCDGTSKSEKLQTVCCCIPFNQLISYSLDQMYANYGNTGRQRVMHLFIDTFIVILCHSQ